MEQLTRKEESLIEWQDALCSREMKLESGEDNLHGLMREIRIKDTLLSNKDIEIKRKDQEMEDSVGLQLGSPKWILPTAYHTALSHKPAPERSRRTYDKLLLAHRLCPKLVYGSPVQR